MNFYATSTLLKTENPHEEGKHEYLCVLYFRKEESYSTPRWLIGRIQMPVFCKSLCTDQPAHKQISILDIQI